MTSGCSWRQVSSVDMARNDHRPLAVRRFGHRRDPGADRRRRAIAPSPSPRRRCTTTRCRCGSGPRSSTTRPQRLTERREEFATIIAKEAAKPIKTARVEAERAVGTFQFAAAEARKLSGEMIPLDAIPAGEGKLGFTLRVPIGVVGAIAPFNFPLNLVAHKLAPAIAAGCPVVLKPASQTPFSSIALAKMLIDECGLPADYLHVVTGGGGTVGNAIVDHPDIALITFTGSPEVGWGIRARAPRKRVGLELGNNAPVIIEPDGDWKTAAAKIKVAGFSHAGQSCISTQRIYVHRSIADDFTAALVDHVNALVVGDPLDEATDVSALISRGRARPGRVVGRRGRGRRRQGRSPAARSATTACCARRSSPTPRPT